MPQTLLQAIRTAALVDIFQGEEIAVEVFWILVPVSDLSFLGEAGRVLEFFGPDGIIRSERKRAVG